MIIRAKDLKVGDIFKMKDLSVMNGSICEVKNVLVTRKSVRVKYIISNWSTIPHETGFHHDQKIELISKTV